MAKKKYGPGTSRFTHRDDAQANLHTTHLAHHEALHWGAEEPDPDDREAIILGPPPFGSPDPATLGHRMHPHEARPSSAPPLDPAFHELQGTAHLVNYTEEEILAMSKADLIELARENDIPVKSNATRADLLDALGYGEEGDDSEDEDEDSEDDESESKSESETNTENQGNNPGAAAFGVRP